MDEKKILATKDYGMFKTLEGNRTVTADRINKIKKSIYNVGYITSPILVNEKMEIIDGQGRFEALKELEMPIEYIVQEGLTIKECVSMNIHQTNWNIYDYIDSYAKRGNENYIWLKKLLEEFAPIHDISVYAVAIKKIGRLPITSIREGTYEMTKEEYESAREKLLYVKDLYIKYKKMARISWVICAMLFIYDVERLDKKRLLEKIDITLADKNIPSMQRMDDALMFIEDVYNKNIKGEKLYLYTEFRKIVDFNTRKGQLQASLAYKARQEAKELENTEEKIKEEN